MRLLGQALMFDRVMTTSGSPPLVSSFFMRRETRQPQLVLRSEATSQSSKVTEEAEERQKLTLE